MEDFQYVVYKAKNPKVAFLSGQPRKTLNERKGYDRMECEIVTQPPNDLGPGSYPESDKVNAAFSKTKQKVVSKLGLWPLVSKNKRIQRPITADSPAPNVYKLKDSFEIKQDNHFPFNSTTNRNIFQQNDLPGVCTYDTTFHEKDHSIQFEHSFGGRTKLKPIIQLKCTPENKDICQYCNEKPKGDYWIQNEGEEIVACNHCYNNKMLYADKHTDVTKSKYQKIRDCSSIHSHEGTTATIPIMSDKDLIKQTIRECYLHSYMPTHVVKKKKPPTKIRKSALKHAEPSVSDPNVLFSKIRKFVDSLYSETEAEFLKNRDISDKRVREILTPLSLVPDQETLMKHFIKEEETYKGREYPKGKGTRLRSEIEKLCSKWEWRYKEKMYTRSEIIKEQEIPEEVVAKLRKSTDEEVFHPEPRESEAYNQIRAFVENEMDKDEKKRIPIISEYLQYAITLIPTTIKEYHVDSKVTGPLKTEDEEEVPQIKTGWSELDLLQSPEVPLLPKPFIEGQEPIRKEDLHPDIQSLFDDSDAAFSDQRSLSLQTIASRTKYPHVT